MGKDAGSGRGTGEGKGVELRETGKDIGRGKRERE